MEIFYCKSWFRAKKIPTEIYSSDKAEKYHRAGKTYTALIGSPASPECFLDISSTVIGVGFLDARLRESTLYAFQVQECGRLFLSMAVWREFEGDTDKVVSGSTYLFKVNGNLEIRRESFSPVYEAETASSIVDVTNNWDDYPGFANFEALTRRER